jgi:hypothetical protein
MKWLLKLLSLSNLVSVLDGSGQQRWWLGGALCWHNLSYSVSEVAESLLYLAWIMHEAFETLPFITIQKRL